MSEKHYFMGKKNLTRRQFMSTLTAGAGTILLGRSAFVFPSIGPEASADPFRIVTLGKSGNKNDSYRYGNRIQWI